MRTKMEQADTSIGIPKHVGIFYNQRYVWIILCEHTLSVWRGAMKEVVDVAAECWYCLSMIWKGSEPAYLDSKSKFKSQC